MKKPVSKPVKALLAVLLLATVAWVATVRPGGVDMSDCYVGVYAVADGGIEECLALERMGS